MFDIGANEGSYTRHVLSVAPQSRVHCFEIVPQTRALLASDLASVPGVVLAEHGLSDTPGFVDVEVGADTTQSRVATSVPAPGVAPDAAPVACRVERGDDYLADAGVDVVDFMKVDTEGHEMSVLRGFSESLAEGRIRVVQFEYGTTWVGPGRLLREAYELLTPYGFQIGRMYPDGIFFKSYERLEDDHFRMGNYLAVRDDNRSLIDALNINPAGRSRRVVPL